MNTFDSVLRDACALPPEDRERLILHMHWSLDPEVAPVDEAAYIAELDAIARRANANPDSLADWESARREIFDGLSDG